MSCLIWIYTVCPLVFEFLLWCSVYETLFENFAGVNCVACCLGALRVIYVMS